MTELAELLARASGIQGGSAQPQAAVDPLKALLNRAQSAIAADVARKREADAIEKSRKALAAGQLDKREAEQTRNAIALWEARHVWQTIGRTAVFIRHACTCGECHTVFSHWMLHQRHREVGTRERHIRASAEVMDETCRETAPLKPKVGFQERNVEMCAVCAGKHEVDLSGPLAFQTVEER